MFYGYCVEQASGPTTVGTASTEVVKSMLPLIGSERIRQGALAGAAVTIDNANFFAIIFSPSPISFKQLVMMLLAISSTVFDFLKAIFKAISVLTSSHARAVFIPVPHRIQTANISVKSVLLTVNQSVFFGICPVLSLAILQNIFPILCVIGFLSLLDLTLISLAVSLSLLRYAFFAMRHEAVGALSALVEIFIRCRLLLAALPANFAALLGYQFANLDHRQLVQTLLARAFPGIFPAISAPMEIIGSGRQPFFAGRAPLEDFGHTSLHKGLSSIVMLIGQGCYGNTPFGRMISRGLVLSA